MKWFRVALSAALAAVAFGLTLLTLPLLASARWLVPKDEDDDSQSGV